MSLIRKCCNTKCGWEFPLSYTKSYCKFCRTRFDEQFCHDCDKLKPMSEFYKPKNGVLHRRCIECNQNRLRQDCKDHPDRHAARQYAQVARRREAAEKMLAEWTRITQIDFKPLTEEQWLEACSYFEGCAICGHEVIETRQFLIQFQHGGRYAPWNVFPMCGKCSVTTRLIYNPFIWLDNILGRQAKHMGLTKERKDRLLMYFILQIEKAGGSLE